jgi:hypothetical protein
MLETTEQLVQPVRVITIFSTQGGVNEYKTDITKFHELEELASDNYNFDNMTVVDEFERTYQSSEAILPEGNFTMFLTPAKSKSGAGELPYNVVRARIREIMQGSDEAVRHFNQGGRNYTNKSASDLRALLAIWESNYTRSTVPQNSLDSLDNLELVNEAITAIETDNNRGAITYLNELHDRFVDEDNADFEDELTEEDILEERLYDIMSRLG